MAKRAVNHTLDTMGFSNAIESCFDMHHLGHARALAATAGKTVVMANLDRMKTAGRSGESGLPNARETLRHIARRCTREARARSLTLAVRGAPGPGFQNCC